MIAEMGSFEPRAGSGLVRLAGSTSVPQPCIPLPVGSLLPLPPRTGVVVESSRLFPDATPCSRQNAILQRALAGIERVLGSGDVTPKTQAEISAIKSSLGGGVVFNVEASPLGQPGCSDTSTSPASVTFGSPIVTPSSRSSNGTPIASSSRFFFPKPPLARLVSEEASSSGLVSEEALSSGFGIADSSDTENFYASSSSQAVQPPVAARSDISTNGISNYWPAWTMQGVCDKNVFQTGTSIQKRTLVRRESYSQEFRPGVTVQIRGLQNDVHSNGKSVILESFDDSSQLWRAQLTDGSKRTVLLKPQNIALQDNPAYSKEVTNLDDEVKSVLGSTPQEDIAKDIIRYLPSIIKKLSDGWSVQLDYKPSPKGSLCFKFKKDGAMSGINFSKC